MSKETNPIRGWARRDFFKFTGASLGFSALSPVCRASGQTATARRLKIERDDMILFQGDSITDASRDQKQAATPNKFEALGSGYAWQAAMELLIDRPGDGLKIFNCGVSGDKVYQLANRWEKDCLALKPNVLSILVGVNDYWHIVKHGYKGSVEIYERDYRALLARTLKALPNVKLVIGEPFVLQEGAVDQSWFPAFDAYREASARVAQTYSAVFIPYQSLFNKAVELAPAAEWLKDGVHPTTEGASLMAYHWLKAVGE